MANPSFRDQVMTWFHEGLGGDPFPDGIPEAPPAWVRRAMKDTATVERNWAVFRDRWGGTPLPMIATRHGLPTVRVYAVSLQVVSAILRARRPAPRRLAVRPPSSPAELPRSMLASVLARDCATVNAVGVRFGIPRLRVEALVRAGIDVHTPLSHVPDEALLRVGGVGPKTVARIRRLFPFEDASSGGDEAVARGPD